MKFTNRFCFIVDTLHPFLLLLSPLLLSCLRLLLQLIVAMDGLNGKVEDGSKGLKPDAGGEYPFGKVIGEVLPDILERWWFLAFQFRIELLLDIQKLVIILFQKFTEF